MPAAAVIPAPIAYIKVVAVKKLVVEFRGRGTGSALRRVCLCSRSFLSETGFALYCVSYGFGVVTVSKSECSKQAFARMY